MLHLPGQCPLSSVQPPVWNEFPEILCLPTFSHKVAHSTKFFKCIWLRAEIIEQQEILHYRVISIDLHLSRSSEEPRSRCAELKSVFVNFSMEKEKRYDTPKDYPWWSINLITLTNTQFPILQYFHLNLTVYMLFIIYNFIFHPSWRLLLRTFTL